MVTANSTDHLSVVPIQDILPKGLTDISIKLGVAALNGVLEEAAGDYPVYRFPFSTWPMASGCLGPPAGSTVLCSCPETSVARNP